MPRWRRRPTPSTWIPPRSISGKWRRRFSISCGRAFPTARKSNKLKDLLVMKFGGTSVGSAERMRVSARLAAEEQKKRPVAVVVSAMSKVTDLLLDTMRRAEAGDRAGMESNLTLLRQRHEAVCRELLPSGEQ